MGPAKQQATTVRFEELGSNVLMFVGDDHESVATAFLDGDDVLLVDSLGSMDDARWLRRVLCGDRGKTVGSEARRVVRECASTCRSRWATSHKKNKHIQAKK